MEDEARWSDSGGFARSIGATGGICMDMDMGSAEARSGGYKGICGGMWWVGEMTASVWEGAFREG